MHIFSLTLEKMKLLAALLVALPLASATIIDPAQYVDNFIGSRNGGHVFVGASKPFGSVKGEQMGRRIISSAESLTIGI